MGKLRVSIFGCGWLGSSLGERLVSEFIVKGSTSEQRVGELRTYGIDSCVLTLKDFMGNRNFFKCDILVISLPSSVYGSEDNLDLFRDLIFRLYPHTKIIFLSSTSIYTGSGKIDEDGAVNTESSLRNAERIVLESKQKSYVIRLAGLMGYSRYLAKYYTDKTEAKNCPVNHIHRNDAVEMLYQLITRSIPDGIYNMCAPLHPTKEAILKMAKLKLNYLPCDKKRVINGERLSKILHYNFKYPDPKRF